MKTITIRGLKPAVVDALKKAAQERNVSLNRFILEILEDTVHVERTRTPPYHDLDGFFGTWNQSDHKRIQEEVRRQRKIDAQLWR